MVTRVRRQNDVANLKRQRNVVVKFVESCGQQRIIYVLGNYGLKCARRARTRFRFLMTLRTRVTYELTEDGHRSTAVRDRKTDTSNAGANNGVVANRSTNIFSEKVFARITSKKKEKHSPSMIRN